MNLFTRSSKSTHDTHVPVTVDAADLTGAGVGMVVHEATWANLARSCLPNTPAEQPVEDEISLSKSTQNESFN